MLRLLDAYVWADDLFGRDEADLLAQRRHHWRAWSTEAQAQLMAMLWHAEKKHKVRLRIYYTRIIPARPGKPPAYLMCCRALGPDEVASAVHSSYAAERVMPERALEFQAISARSLN